MKGGDFAREDAIVNLFHPDERATVELRLEGETPVLMLKRTRKMGSSTGRGRQPLQLEMQGESKKDEDAEKELESRLRISLEGFSQNKYLHQEAIREALASRPEERSEAIDKLLGTFEVREFASALDIDRQIDSAIKRINSSLQSLDRDKIQFNLNLRRKLEDNQKALMSRGFTKDELTLGSAIEILTSVRSLVAKTEERFGQEPLQYPLLSPNVQAIAEAQKKLVDETSILDRTRMELFRKSQERVLSLQHLSKNYSSLLTRFADSKAIDNNSLKKRMETIDFELMDLDAKGTIFQKKVTTLPSRRSVYEDLKRQLGDEQSKLASLEQKFGKEETIEKRTSQVDEELKSCAADLEKLSEHQRLIKIAIDVLENTKATACPVCSQSVDNVTLVLELKAKVSKDIGLSIGKLHDTEKQLKQTRQELEDAKRNVERLTQTMEAVNKELKVAADAISAIIEKKLEEDTDLDVIWHDWDDELKGVSNRVGKLRSERREIEETIKHQDQLISELGMIKKQLQKETGSLAEGSSLLDKVKECLSQIDVECGKYKETSDIDESRLMLTRLSEILIYLRDEENLEVSERELPVVSKQIQDLKARVTSLQLLAGSLQSIRKLANEFERDTSLARFKILENEINSFYSAILGHPHFAKLRVEVEREEPLIYSIRAVSTSEVTYIPTRFSTAQLNATALAIFMSNSAQMAGELPLMILDDPTQSMDSAHKEAFAKLITKASSQYQIIVSTEDEETKDFLVKHCSKIMIYEFGQWTITGPSLKEPT